jgi:putative hemolysin
VVLDAAVDARGLEEPDQDRERAVTVHLLEVDHLLVVDLADDDPREFHLHAHDRRSAKVGRR